MTHRPPSRPSAQPQCVVFVSAGMLAPKKRDHVLARRQQYLNYGALTLATQLAHSGTPAMLFHGGHQPPEDVIAILEMRGLLPSPYPIMLSLPSFYALAWAQEFCECLHARHPSSRIVVGGRWVTGPDPEWLQTLIPHADRIVPGLGESVIAQLVNPAAKVDTQPALPDIGLDHTLVDGFRSFQPSIETSRGCGMGCAFCEERAIRLSPLRAPARLAELLEETQEQYGDETVRPYLQSSFFLPNPRWAARFAEEVVGRGLRISWRCETRVDAMKPETVASLAAAGLKVIDLGLESASPAQIQAMKKAEHPDRYLRAASDLVTACRENGVWVKANVLIYAGETAKTVEETRKWLDDHSGSIKGVSVGPVVVFGPPSTTASFVTELETQGARMVDASSAARTGITQVHPSASIDAHDAEGISLWMSRRFMDRQAYFDLKNFSYYPRDYDRAQFDRDVDASPSNSLPFR